jgi:hypothetical protein
VKAVKIRDLVKADEAAYVGIGIHGAALLEAAPCAAPRSIRALRTTSYWEICRRIVEFKQEGGRRAEYRTRSTRALPAATVGILPNYASVSSVESVDFLTEAAKFSVASLRLTASGADRP